ncbi:MAG TPA: hypothetical protein VIU61_30315 [Kofleriaceae bacterium]
MPEPLCVVCKKVGLVSPIEIDRRACDPCALKTGIVVIPPPRRRLAPCVRCNHTRLIRVIPRELSVAPGVDENEPTYGPMFATYELRTVYSVVQSVQARAGFGVFEAYICKGCGFVEWFCQDPDEIPIGPEYMTEEITTDGPSAFR